MVKNPILTGFYPDPSVCRAGDRFYLVCSTFTYFPGVPIFESRDLADWKQIGNILDRDSQIPLTGLAHSEGIFAPTIRYHNGRFYLITTNVPSMGNFVVTAEDPAGPWSEPYYLGEAAQGIDPSLFFDEDGTCWYTGQRYKSCPKYNGDCEIWVQRFDPDTMRLEGEATAVLDGFQKNAVWPEGPHLYQKDGYYYILHAEGGTAFHHSVMVARSRNLLGPYEYCPTNPILTHRHLGQTYPVTSVGHGDLVEDGAGNWYMVVLACRPQEGYTLLGRETFLARVTWEDGWPVVNAGVGRLEDQVEIPGHIGPAEIPGRSWTYTFAGDSLPPEFMTLRNHRERVLSLSAKPGVVRLFMRADSLLDRGEPAYLAIRQQHHYFEAETAFSTCFSAENGCAGMALVQSNENHVRAECYRENGQIGIRVIQAVDGTDTVLGLLEDIDPADVWLKLTVRGLRADVWCREGHRKPRLLAADIDLRPLSTERAGGFVGCTVGMFASGSGKDTDEYADFSVFRYRSLSRTDS